MSVIFNLDGTTTHTPEKNNLQEELENSIDQYQDHLSSGYDELRVYRDDELKASGQLGSTTKIKKFTIT